VVVAITFMLRVATAPGAGDWVAAGVQASRRIDTARSNIASL